MHHHRAVLVTTDMYTYAWLFIRVQVSSRDSVQPKIVSTRSDIRERRKDICDIGERSYRIASKVSISRFGLWLSSYRGHDPFSSFFCIPDIFIQTMTRCWPVSIVILSYAQNIFIIYELITKNSMLPFYYYGRISFPHRLFLFYFIKYSIGIEKRMLQVFMISFFQILHIIM